MTLVFWKEAEENAASQQQRKKKKSWQARAQRLSSYYFIKQTMSVLLI
jgi:hypothetical protein